MSSNNADPLREQLESLVGKPLGTAEPTPAPEPVNSPMIHHWIDAFDDRNPIYEGELDASNKRFRHNVAPPAMLQAWSMPRPELEGIAERGGSPVTVENSPLEAFDQAGYSGTLATNSELEFERYLKPGDELKSAIVLESISDRKSTGLGEGYFVTWLTTYTDQQDAVVGRQRFRVLKFKPAAAEGAQT